MRELATAHRIDEEHDQVRVREQVVAARERRAQLGEIGIVRAHGGVQRLVVVREANFGLHARLDLGQGEDLPEAVERLRVCPTGIVEVAVQDDSLRGAEAMGFDRVGFRGAARGEREERRHGKESCHFCSSTLSRQRAGYGQGGGLAIPTRPSAPLEGWTAPGGFVVRR
ncbi:MAG: hypothetical protein ACXWAC_03295 [Usitatibacter sp.]